MVAIRSREADRFLARDATGFLAYLVFGTDVGLVSERVRTLVKLLVDDPADPFQVVRLRGEEVAGNPGRLADEVDTMPMFGGRRVVTIDGAGRDLTPALTHHLASGAGTPVIVEAGGLKKDSGLRKLVERARTAVAIECFPDEERDVVRLIETEIEAAGLTIDPDATAMLAGLLGADRLASRGEIAKLALYAHGRAAVTAADVEAVVADAAAQATDALVDATFAGDIRAVELAGRRVLAGPVESGLFLGAALRHAMWLHRASLDLANGGSLDQAMSQSGRAGISPLRRTAVERQLRTAAPEALALAVIRLGEAVGRARREPLLAQSLALRTLWTIARSVQRRTRAASA